MKLIWLLLIYLDSKKIDIGISIGFPPHLTYTPHWIFTYRNLVKLSTVSQVTPVPMFDYLSTRWFFFLPLLCFLFMDRVETSSSLFVQNHTISSSLPLTCEVPSRIPYLGLIYCHQGRTGSRFSTSVDCSSFPHWLWGTSWPLPTQCYEHLPVSHFCVI